MRIAEMLNAIANWLESPNNEAMLLAEYNENCLKVVAESCVKASNLLKNAADQVDSIEPQNDNFDSEIKPDRELADQNFDKLLDAIKSDNWYEAGKLFGEIDKVLGNARMDAVEAIRVLPYTADNLPRVPLSKWTNFGLGYCDAWNLSDEDVKKEIDLINKFTDQISNRASKKEAGSTSVNDLLNKIANLANIFDSSGDIELKKQASVIDELLLTVAASEEYKNKLAADSKRFEQIKKNYEDTKTSLDDKKKIADTKKTISDSEYMKKNHTLISAPLQTRHCPDHAGVSMGRVDDNTFQCPLDKKTYNFEIGYDLMNGDHVPGGSVANQSAIIENNNMTTTFDTRENKLSQIKYK